jgi:hypothetical protein
MTDHTDRCGTRGRSRADDIMQFEWFDLPDDTMRFEWFDLPDDIMRFEWDDFLDDRKAAAVIADEEVERPVRRRRR